MVIDNSNLQTLLESCGDKTGPYSDEEEKAIQNFLNLIEGDEEMKIWVKYAHKTLLIAALRGCKLDAALGYKMLKQFHGLAIKTYPELLGCINPANLKKLIEAKIFQIVKRPVDKGPAVLVARIGNWHISDGAIEDYAIAGAIYLWWISRQSAEIQREGVIGITDMSGFKLKHARQVSIDLVKMGVKFHSILPPPGDGALTGAASNSAAVAFNSFSLVEDTYNAFKGLLPKDIKKMVHITKNDTTVLTKLIGKEFLPAEFGGSIPDEEAYVEGIYEEMVKGQDNIFDLIKHVQDEVLSTYGLKRRERKVKDKKDKKEKKEKNGN